MCVHGCAFTRHVRMYKQVCLESLRMMYYIPCAYRCSCVCVHGCRLARHVRMHMWACIESPRTVYVYHARVGVHASTRMSPGTPCLCMYAYVSVSRVSAHDVCIHTMRVQVCKYASSVCAHAYVSVSPVSAHSVCILCACRCACEHMQVC
jgi:hypothetical protein